MSIWLQIGAGILPALIILLLYLMIIRKNVVSSLILLFMFTAGLSLCVFHSKLPLSGGSRTASWKAAPAENTDAVKSAQAQADALPRMRPSGSSTGWPPGNKPQRLPGC